MMDKVYVVEYRTLVNKDRGEWLSKISQEGYKTLKSAQKFIEGRSSNPTKVSKFYYQTAHFEEYYIHEITIV